MSFGTRGLAQPASVVSRPPKRKRWLLSLISLVLVVLAGVAGRVAGDRVYEVFSGPTSSKMEKMLLQVVDQTKPALPKKMDDVTTMTDISYQGKQMTYVYNLDFQGKQSPANFMAVLHKQVVTRVCGSKMTQATKQGISFTFRYNNPAGNEVGEFTVSAADCT